MGPPNKLIHFLERVIRDSAERLGKEVDFSIGGTPSPELQNDDALRDALAHLVRNAVDHGIAQVGTVHLFFKRLKNGTEITVSDDGGGLFADGIREKAKALGLETIPIEEAIFLPGFSTRERADALSGHGLGLHTVREFLRQRNGTISVSQPLSGGSIFRIFLPASPQKI